MKLIDALNLGMECGLETVEEALRNVNMHSQQLFSLSEIEWEIAALREEWNRTEELYGFCMEDKIEDVINFIIKTGGAYTSIDLCRHNIYLMKDSINILNKVSNIQFRTPKEDIMTEKQFDHFSILEIKKCVKELSSLVNKLEKELDRYESVHDDFPDKEYVFSELNEFFDSMKNE